MLKMSQDKLFEIITENIMKLTFNKKDFDVLDLIKKMKFNLKNNFENNKVHVAIGNEGNVFDSIIAGKNKNKEKIIILFSKKREEPFFILLDTIKDKNLQNLIDNINQENFIINGKDLSNELKNKSLQLTYISNEITKILEK